MTIRILLSLLLCIGAATEAWAQRLEGRPNIVVFLADDAGWNDVGYHGSEIRTPHIDRLARDGVQLEEFYAYPTCSPTRAALLTGRPASRFGIHQPIAGTSREALPSGVTTLPGLLRRDGYHTAITGKWHLGLDLDVGPQHYGFDHTYGALHGQVDPYTHRYKFGDETWHRNGRLIREEGHATDLIAREAIRFVRELRDPARPFFLYVAFTVPHYPLDEPEGDVLAYAEAIPNPSRRRYAAAMTHMDSAIGEILHAVEEQGLEDNTLVVFASDNGGQQSWGSPATEYEGRYPAHDQLGDNAPLRGWKGDLYEGGIRVPAVVYWPGRLKPRTVSEPIAVYDLLPTLIGAAGSTVGSMDEIEGMDVWPALEGRALPERPVYIRAPTEQAIRIGPWKLIHRGADPLEGPTELFNLSVDRSERRELSARHPEVVKTLRRELARQLEADG